MIKEQTQKPAFQIGHALTTLALLGTMVGWVVAGDKEQAKEISETNQKVIAVETRQEMMIRQQDKMDEKLDKLLEGIHKLGGGND